MKKSTSILAVAAVVGLSALTATPASATIGAYPNCSAAAAAGAFNIAIGTPGYGPHLDSDGDGVGCERAAEDGAVDQAPVQTQAPVETQAPAPTQAPAQSQVRAQVAKKPVGGAPTGVEQESDMGMGFLALGGLVAAAATATVVVRRRSAVKA
ncbi:excalibur calcium-binding domain-containing protein [Pseudarthrobacter sp. NPDC058329]|uniref:excalibur calcium-binding domain-containing protein n=1 Tax=Pseudarthrobacter sp. NPDC058329 TaxID=3346448 RepID=UPI0036DEA514